MVVMSISYYRRLQQRLEMLQKLHVAEAQRAQGDTGKPYQDVIQELRGKLYGRDVIAVLLADEPE